MSYHVNKSKKQTRNIIIASIIAVLLLGGLVTGCSALNTVDRDSVGFAIGGGFADPAKNKVKGELMLPGRRITGTWDDVAQYPAYKTLRFQDFTVAVTTLDGKPMTLQGQMAFRFVGEKDKAKAKEFAEGLGARKYGGVRPGDNEVGWENFLDQMVTPEITSVLKDMFGRVNCADFEPSCRVIDPRSNIATSEPEKVYEQVSVALQKAVDKKLEDESAGKVGSYTDNKYGNSYLRNIRVRVAKITLPEEVQANINQVTAEQGKTKAAEQSIKTANAEAKAITVKGKALRKNRDLISIEVARECRGGDKCTVILDGTGKSSVPVR